MSDYVLGTGDHELARLELQQEVWGARTEGFLDALDLAPGARVIDLGCGPGLVLAALRERVGAAGRVEGLDASERWGREVEDLAARHGWDNVRFTRASILEHDLGEARYDLIFARWVLSFLPEPAALVARLARALKPGGLLAVQDYNHEGVSLFPESEAFGEVIRATRELYAAHGGDTWLGARLPGLMRAEGLTLTALDATVLCGPPGSPAFRWADAFFPHHTEGMVAAGLLSEEQRERFLRDWQAHLDDPGAMFFSPIVVSIAGRRR